MRCCCSEQHCESRAEARVRGWRATPKIGGAAHCILCLISSRQPAASGEGGVGKNETGSIPNYAWCGVVVRCHKKYLPPLACKSKKGGGYTVACETQCKMRAAPRGRLQRALPPRAPLRPPQSPLPWSLLQPAHCACPEAPRRCCPLRQGLWAQQTEAPSAQRQRRPAAGLWGLHQAPGPSG